ncbi:hypothetical protein Tco_0589036 [Tanacetum coccineum]
MAYLRHAEPPCLVVSMVLCLPQVFDDGSIPVYHPPLLYSLFFIGHPSDKVLNSEMYFLALARYLIIESLLASYIPLICTGTSLGNLPYLYYVWTSSFAYSSPARRASYSASLLGAVNGHASCVVSIPGETSGTLKSIHLPFSHLGRQKGNLLILTIYAFMCSVTILYGDIAFHSESVKRGKRLAKSSSSAEKGLLRLRGPSSSLPAEALHSLQGFRRLIAFGESSSNGDHLVWKAGVDNYLICLSSSDSTFPILRRFLVAFSIGYSHLCDDPCPGDNHSICLGRPSLKDRTQVLGGR